MAFKSLPAAILYALIWASSVTAQTPQESDLPPSPGAVPPEAVEENALARDAQPNFANRGSLEAYVDGVVNAFMGRDHIAGVTVSIVRNGEIVLAKGYGIAGVDPERSVDPERTLFRIGSISKTFTWTALLQLDETGELNLEDPVDLHLPTDLRPGMGGFDTPLLVRHLMEHTPGFEDSALGHLFFKDPQEVLPLYSYLAEYRPERVREPGRLVAYSNYGAGLAGAIVSNIANLTFQAYAEQSVFQPLEMTHSSFREPMPEGVAIVRKLPRPMAAELAQNLSAGFAFERGGLTPKPISYITQIAPAGAASSTATDMARYMLAHLDDGQLGDARILEPGTARRIRTALADRDGGPPELALGFIDYTLPGGYRGFGHGGATLYFMSNMVMVPELDLGIFVSANTNTGRPLAMRLPQLIVARYFAETNGETSTSVEMSAAQAERFAGTYLSLRRPYTTVEAPFLAAGALSSVSALPEGQLLLESPGADPRRFAPVDPLTFREVGGSAILGFRENEAGEITHLIDPLGIAWAERIGFLAHPAWLGVSLNLAVLGSIGALVGGWLRRKRAIAQSLWEARAGKLMPALGGLWLLFIGLFAAAAVGMAQAGNEAIFTFPGGLLVTALAAGLLSGLASLAAAASLWPIWRTGSWPLWRRIRHSLLSLIWLSAALTLAHWNLIGFQYY